MAHPRARCNRSSRSVASPDTEISKSWMCLLANGYYKKLQLTFAESLTWVEFRDLDESRVRRDEVYKYISKCSIKSGKACNRMSLAG